MNRVDGLRLDGLTVLLADGSKFNRKLLAQMLAEFGVTTILEAEDGEAAHEALRRGPIDLVICDTLLEKQDGITLTRAVRHEAGAGYRAVPILLLAGHTRQGDIIRMRDCGASMILAKPVAPKALYDRLAWIAKDPRPFVESAVYSGPDRRHREDDPPNGLARRQVDRDRFAAETDSAVTPAEIAAILDQCDAL